VVFLDLEELTTFLFEEAGIAKERKRWKYLLGMQGWNKKSSAFRINQALNPVPK
jgi:hypothetical protein